MMAFMGIHILVVDGNDIWEIFSAGHIAFYQ